MPKLTAREQLDLRDPSKLMSMIEDAISDLNRRKKKAVYSSAATAEKVEAAIKFLWERGTLTNYDMLELSRRLDTLLELLAYVQYGEKAVEYDPSIYPEEKEEMPGEDLPVDPEAIRIRPKKEGERRFELEFVEGGIYVPAAILLAAALILPLILE